MKSVILIFGFIILISTPVQACEGYKDGITALEAVMGIEHPAPLLQSRPAVKAKTTTRTYADVRREKVEEARKVPVTPRNTL